MGLNWNHQDWRFIDLARGPVWHGVDPLSEAGQESWSPYAYNFANAVRYSDPNGKKPGCCGEEAVQSLNQSMAAAEQAVRAAGASVSNAASNAAGAVGRAWDSLTTPGTTNSKPASSPGIAIFINGSHGDESKLGGTQEGPAVDLSNLPNPIPNDPTEKAKTALDKGKAIVELFSFGLSSIEKAGKVNDGETLKAIENDARSAKSQSAPKEKLLRSDTSAAGQSFSGADGKQYRAVYQQKLVDGKPVNSIKRIPAK